MKKVPVVLFVFLLVVIGCLLLVWGRHNFSPSTPAISEKRIKANTPVDHIVVIMMENKAYHDVFGSADAPYINSLIKKYSLADNYSAITHPSLPNYLALIGGSTFGVTTDCTDCFVASPNLIDQLEGAHKTWKAYMESMPSSCFIGNSGLYAQKHNPFIYFDDVRNNPNRCMNIVPYIALSKDLQSESTTPNFIWVSPNLCHDMHNCSVAEGDMWLSQQIPLILTSPAFTNKRSFLVLTWDEGQGAEGNRIMTIFVGPDARQAYVSHTAYSHYSLLHTIELLWDMPAITSDVSRSAVMSDMLQ